MSRSAYVIGTAALAARRSIPFAPSTERDDIVVTPRGDAIEPQQMVSYPNAEGGRTVDGGGPPIVSALRPVEGEGVPPPVSLGGRLLKSELPNVSDAAWTAFALAMKVQGARDVSGSNSLGMFAMRPRRLGDLGVLENLRSTRLPTGRLVWVGDWVAPMTQDKFLSSPKDQYRVFAASMLDYVEGIDSGEVPAPDDLPADMTMSGALAILHRCGPGGLKSWGDGEGQFPETVALYNKVNGIF